MHAGQIMPRAPREVDEGERRWREYATSIIGSKMRQSVQSSLSVDRFSNWCGSSCYGGLLIIQRWWRTIGRGRGRGGAEKATLTRSANHCARWRHPAVQYLYDIRLSAITSPEHLIMGGSFSYDFLVATRSLRFTKTISAYRSI